MWIVVEDAIAKSIAETGTRTASGNPVLLSDDLRDSAKHGGKC